MPTRIPSRLYPKIIAVLSKTDKPVMFMDIAKLVCMHNGNEESTLAVALRDLIDKGVVRIVPQKNPIMIRDYRYFEMTPLEKLAAL